LSKNNIAKSCRIHRLVALHFIENDDPINKKIVDHINNKKLNNKVVNLRWVTPSQNNKYYNDNFRKDKIREVLQFNKNNKFIKEWNNVKEIVNSDIKYKSGNILKCINGGSITAYGYIWKYKYDDKYINKKDEIFKNIGTIEGNDFSMYKISNYGNVYSLYKDRILKSPKSTSGYKQVGLVDKNTHENYKFCNHRLVAYLFLDKIDGKNIVNHINEKKLDNHYKNLEWTTDSENVNHSIQKIIIMF
jgi:hypothetical protein